MRVAKRRRRENKTDYGKRIKLLKSNTPRVIFRKTNKYIMTQYSTSKEAQDKIEINTNSKELLKHGWPKEFSGSLKSISASYLTGLLMGKKILEKKLSPPIVDFGMIRMIHKSKPYAFLKGMIDAGVNIKCKEEAFPVEERISGQHLKKDFLKIFQEIKSNIEKQ